MHAFVPAGVGVQDATVTNGGNIRRLTRYVREANEREQIPRCTYRASLAPDISIIITFLPWRCRSILAVERARIDVSQST